MALSENIEGWSRYSMKKKKKRQINCLTDNKHLPDSPSPDMTSQYKTQIKSILSQLSREQGCLVRQKFLSGSLMLVPEDGYGQAYYPLLKHLIQCMKQLLEVKQGALESSENVAKTANTQEIMALLSFLFILIPKVALQVCIPCLFPRHPKTMKEMEQQLDSQEEVSLFSHLTPLVSAVIFRLHPNCFQSLEELLLKNLLDQDPLRVLLSQDVWCKISRGNEDARAKHIEFLSQLITLLPIHSVYRRNVGNLISRLLSFAHEDEVSFHVKKFDPIDSQVWSSLKYIKESDRMNRLKKIINRVFSCERCLPTDVLSASHLIHSLPKHVLDQMESGVASKMFKFLWSLLKKYQDEDVGSEVKMILEESLALLSVHVSAEKILVFMKDPSNIKFKSVFIDILHKNRNRLTGASIDVCVKILSFSRNFVDVNSDSSVMKWLEFVYSFQENVPDSMSFLDDDLSGNSHHQSLKEIFDSYSNNFEILNDNKRVEFLLNVLAEDGDDYSHVIEDLRKRKSSSPTPDEEQNGKRLRTDSQTEDHFHEEEIVEELNQVSVQDALHDDLRDEQEVVEDGNEVSLDSEGQTRDAS